MSDAAATFVPLRPLLLRIAYRMLGSAGDAEDVVQEAWMRWHGAVGGPAEIAAPRAYLSRVVTRLCIDRLREQASERARYEGPWLPEPLVDEPAGAGERLQLAESLRLGFLVVLESLNPVERAVFLLREVFDYDYAEIAEIVGKSEDNCRQISARARAHVSARRPLRPASREEQERVAGAFFGALSAGDLGGLTALLAQDAVTYSDGGGKVTAARRPVHGADRVARLLHGLAKKGAGLTVRPAWVNGEPAVLAYKDGQAFSVVVLEIAGGVVHGVRIVQNPDKLRRVPAPPA